MTSIDKFYKDIDELHRRVENLPQPTRITWTMTVTPPSFRDMWVVLSGRQKYTSTTTGYWDVS